jgi:peroxiredoxin Q/BCP
MSLATGDPVPDFATDTTDGRLQLSELRGRSLVLYFYPRDDTPGCTVEAKDFSAANGRFLAAGACVLGVSRDSLASHGKFRAKFGIPFPLASDTDSSLCTLFGVVKEKNMYGRKVMGIERSTFLIDGEGVLRRAWRGVKVPGHIDAVLQALSDSPVS